MAGLSGAAPASKGPDGLLGEALPYLDLIAATCGEDCYQDGYQWCAAVQFVWTPRAGIRAGDRLRLDAAFLAYGCNGDDQADGFRRNEHGRQ
jgi:hypothetical protein